MITREEIEEIIKEAPLRNLFSEMEIEMIIEDIYQRFNNLQVVKQATGSEEGFLENENK